MNMMTCDHRAHGAATSCAVRKPPVRKPPSSGHTPALPPPALNTRGERVCLCVDFLWAARKTHTEQEQNTNQESCQLFNRRKFLLFCVHAAFAAHTQLKWLAIVTTIERDRHDKQAKASLWSSTLSARRGSRSLLFPWGVGRFVVTSLALAIVFGSRSCCNGCGLRGTFVNRQACHCCHSSTNTIATCSHRITSRTHARQLADRWLLDQ